MKRVLFFNSIKWFFSFLLFSLFIFPPLVEARPKISKKAISDQIPDDMRELILALYSHNQEKRHRALNRLRDLGPQATPAVPFLESMLHEEMKTIGLFYPFLPGQSAACALGNMGDLGFHALQRALRSRNPAVRANAVLGLLCTKRCEILDDLLPLLDDKSAKVRYNFIVLVGSCIDAYGNNDQTKRILLQALQDSDLSVQESTLFWIDRMNTDAEIVEALKGAVNDFNREIRQRAAAILERTTGKKYKWHRWYD